MKRPLKFRLSRSRAIALVLSAAVLGVLVLLAYSSDVLVKYRFTTLFERIGENKQGYVEYRHKPTGIVFVKVPAGRFQMGTSDGDMALLEREIGRVPASEHERLRESNDHGHRHVVELDSFLIAKYELSQKELRGIMGPDDWIDVSMLKGDELPVDFTTWGFSSRLCRQTGLKLPTEAQWEYACRAGNDDFFAFGDSLDSTQANYYDGRVPFVPGGPTIPVDSSTANGYGLHNMHGNVAEWCADSYDAGFYQRSPLRNPVCSTKSDLRVVRGGAYWSFAISCGSATRLAAETNGAHENIGIRFAYYPVP